MNLTGFALNNTRLTTLVVAMLAVTGVLLFTNFPSKEDPEVTVREAVVAAYFPGMSPERVENLITRQLERQIRLIPEVKTIKSSSKTGVSIIHVVVYDRFFEMEPIWQNLRNKMAEAHPSLPQGTIGPFVNSDFGDVNVATVALTADGFSFEEMRRVARDIRDELYTVDGIRRVELHGVQQERIYLETTNARLARYGLSPDSLVQTLEAQNIILPGGRVDIDGYGTVVEPSGNFDSIEDVRNTVITIPATEQVAYLRDIVTVRRAYEDPAPSLAYYNGHPAIVLAVSMQKTGVNVLDFGPRLQARVAEIEGRAADRLCAGFRHLSGRLRRGVGRGRDPQRLRDAGHRAGHGDAVPGLAHRADRRLDRAADHAGLAGLHGRAGHRASAGQPGDHDHRARPAGR